MHTESTFHHTLSNTFISAKIEFCHSSIYPTNDDHGPDRALDISIDIIRVITTRRLSIYHSHWRHAQDDLQTLFNEIRHISSQSRVHATIKLSIIYTGCSSHRIRVAYIQSLVICGLDMSIPNQSTTMNESTSNSRSHLVLFNVQHKHPSG